MKHILRRHLPDVFLDASFCFLLIVALTLTNSYPTSFLYSFMVLHRRVFFFVCFVVFVFLTSVASKSS